MCATILALSSAAAPEPAAATTPPRGCANLDAIGLSRTIEIDATKGEIYGSVTQAASHDVLKQKEVVLTFDDGPIEGLTRRVLDTLGQHCTKATFFLVGQMAVDRPQIVRETIARGHTVGTHTWSHPALMRTLPLATQIEEIDRGIAAVSRVAGKGLAPFFRFPGLGDRPETLAHLRTRGIATFTVDVVSNDSFITDPRKLSERTLNILAGKGKGILLFHDIKPSTAEALPLLLTELKTQGYRIAHFVPAGRSSGPQPGIGAVASSSAAPSGPDVERLPWGFAHPGQMPEIVPRPVPTMPRWNLGQGYSRGSSSIPSHKPSPSFRDEGPAGHFGSSSSM